MTEKKDKADKTGAAAEGKNNGPLIAVIAVIALVAVGGIFALSGNGKAENDKGKAMSEIAPASNEAPGQTAAANAPSALKPGNPVVAMVNGEEITRNDVGSFIANLPPQWRQMPLQTLFPLALEQVINNKIAADKASKANLTADPEVEKRVTDAKEQIIRDVFIGRQIDERVSQKRLLESYQNLLEEMGEIQETRARHILVDTEEKASEVITKLDAGEDFMALSSDETIGSTAEDGGELGWFAKNEVLPEFAEAAFAIAPGKYSKEPVQTQFGWHVIKVEERRKRPEPDFELVKPQLEVQLRQQILNDLIAGWQKDAKIQKFDINGDPVVEN